MASDAEAIRAMVSRLSGARFELTNPQSNYPRNAENLRWYIVAPESHHETKRPHSKALWEDNDGVIEIESAVLGNTSDWIAEEYGEDAAYEMVDKNLTDFASPEIQREFEKRYPLVLQRIHDYERILAKLSSKREVKLELRYGGGKGLAAFYIDAEINAKNLGISSKLKKIELNWNVLEEVYDEIRIYDAEQVRSGDSRAVTGL